MNKTRQAPNGELTVAAQEAFLQGNGQRRIKDPDRPEDKVAAEVATENRQEARRTRQLLLGWHNLVHEKVVC